MRSLPQPPQSFLQKKSKILEQLSIPDTEYTDASPKGSVDVGIRELIDELNGLEGFVTTSSCAGRVSVFVEGKKAAEGASQENQDEEGARTATVAGVGGKGGGGHWLFVSHDPVEVEDGKTLDDLFGLKNQDASGDTTTGDNEAARLIHFKFEPMILHVLTASLEHAQLLLKCGHQAGFRETGALNLTAAGGEAVTPIVAIRTMGLGLESLVGIQKGDLIQRTVTPDYLQTLLDISHDRFAENSKRIQRFRAAIFEAAQPPKKKDGTEWEDAAARRERKKAQGLRRKAEMEAARNQGQTSDKAEPLDLALNSDLT